VDVHSPDEFTGKVHAPPGMTETAPARGSYSRSQEYPLEHGRSLPYGTFESPDELRAIDLQRKGLIPRRGTVRPHLVCAQIPHGSQ
jgi:hypothetical protein